MWPLFAGLGAIAAALWSMKKSKDDRASANPKALPKPYLAQFVGIRLGEKGGWEVLKIGERAPVRISLLEKVESKPAPSFVPGVVVPDTTREKVLATASLPIVRLVTEQGRADPVGAVFQWEGEHVGDLAPGDYFFASATH